MIHIPLGDDEVAAQRLKELRLAHKYTQSDIASILNVSREAYSMYENGKRQLNYEALSTIAEYYHVSIDYLFGKTNDSEPYELSKEEQMLLFRYRKLAERGRENVFEMAKREYERAEQARNQILSGKAI